MEGRRLVVFCLAVSLFASIAANLFVWMLFVAPLLGVDSQYRRMIDRDRDQIAAQRKEFADWMRDEFERQDREALDRFDQKLAASEQRIEERIDNTMKRIERNAAQPKQADPTRPPVRESVVKDAPVIPIAE